MIAIEMTDHPPPPPTRASKSHYGTPNKHEQRILIYEKLFYDDKTGGGRKGRKGWVYLRVHSSVTLCN